MCNFFNETFFVVWLGFACMTNVALHFLSGILRPELAKPLEHAVVAGIVGVMLLFVLFFVRGVVCW